MMRLAAATATASGTHRATNQDWAALHAAQNGRFLALIADGLGTYTHSAEASVMACDVAQRHLLAAAAPLDRRAVVAAVQAANVALWQSAIDRGVHLKTTLSVLACDTRHAFIAHVGDCRVYLIREQRVRQVTHDHSIAQEGGVLRRVLRPGAQVATRHRLSRVVGDHPMVRVDGETIPLQTTDRFVLCSDGVWGALTETDLAEAMLAEAQDEQTLADRLVYLAQTQGSSDDATAIIITVSAAA